ncbi:hypothetical protein HK098_004181 [Nowakowskiella sp. JEL0407]|nr:hypothetical protein HK098_004181 [Nowakowskiella sp. JEL0407]
MMNNPHQPGVGILNNYAGQAPVNNNYSGQIPVNNNYSGQIPVKNNYSGPQIPVNNLSGPIPVVNSSSIPVVNVDMNAKLRPTSKYSSGLGYIEIVQDPPQQQPQRAIEMMPMQRNYVETPSVSDISSVSRDNYKRRTPPPIKKVPFWKTLLGILTIGVGVTLAVLFSKQAQQSSSKTPGTIARKYVGHTGRHTTTIIFCILRQHNREWDLPTGNVVRTLSGHTDGIYSIAVLDGTPLRLFSGSADKTVREWDLSTGQLSRTYYGSLLDVQAVAVIPGTPPRLFSGSWDNTTREWDMNTGQVIRNFTGHTDSVISLGVLAEDSTIKEWDLTTSANIRTFTGHTAYVEYIAIMPGSTINGGKPRMFSCSSDKTIREWDMSTGETVRTFYGHTSFVLSLAVLDGNPPRLFSGSADNSIREWDVNTAQTVRYIQGIRMRLGLLLWLMGIHRGCFLGGMITLSLNGLYELVYLQIIVKLVESFRIYQDVALNEK